MTTTKNFLAFDLGAEKGFNPLLTAQEVGTPLGAGTELLVAEALPMPSAEHFNALWAKGSGR